MASTGLNFVEVTASVLKETVDTKEVKVSELKRGRELTYTLSYTNNYGEGHPLSLTDVIPHTADDDGSVLKSGAKLVVTAVSISGDAGSALICAAQNEQRLDEHQAQLEGYARFITVDEDGMKQSKAGSAYTTLINESGFHILRRGSAQPVGSFARDGLSAPGLTVGRITARKTARGGWVWEG